METESIPSNYSSAEDEAWMGVDFILACADCHELIDLHKWQIIELAGQFLVHAHYQPGEYDGQLRPQDSPFPLADLDTLCKKLFVTSEQIESALMGTVPDQPYIRELIPVVRAFGAAHRQHRLFLTCDLGDTEQDPWFPGRPGFADWRELPGAFHFHRYLPRNLIEIEGITSWADVVDRMRDEWPFQYASDYPSEIEAIRSAFEERRTRR